MSVALRDIRSLLGPVADFFETTSRIALYFSVFVYIFPVLSYQFNNTGVLFVVEILLHITRYLTLLLLLFNVPLTTYVPFGETVSTKHAFLTKIVGFPSYLVVSTLGLGLLTITRQDDVEFVFSDINQTEAFNLTAYLSGSTDFFTDGVVQFDDALDTLVEELFLYAQNGLFYGSILFSVASFTREKILEVREKEEESDAEAWEKSWYVRTWKDRPATKKLLGRPRQGPVLRNGCICLLACLATIITVIDVGTAQRNESIYNFYLVFAGEALYAVLLFGHSLWKTAKNFTSREQVHSANFAEIFAICQLQFYIALSSPIIVDSDLRLLYAFGTPVVIATVWGISFNRKLPFVAQNTVLDINKLFLVNFREPQRFYRFVSSIAIAAGIIALFFSYYAYIGNAFEFEFTSGTAVDDVTEVVDRVEATFDDVIEEVNNFLRTITPCATTSTFWLNATSLGTNTPGAVNSAQMLTDLQQDDYYDVCFDNNDEFIRPPTDSARCSEPIKSYDTLRSGETNVTTLQDPGGLQDDNDFVDDEGLPPEGFQVLKVDPDCANGLCIAFTVITTVLFALTLIPFANIAAATAAKAARIGWRLSRMGLRMLKYARKIYAKRRKLKRFTNLVRRLAAIGSPVLRWDFAILFMFVPVFIVGLLCILLGFFRRKSQKEVVNESARVRIFFAFAGLTLFNLTLLIGFFGFSADGSNSLRFVQNTMDVLPSGIIQSSVKYGSGMLYLRTCLAVSVGSSGAMSISLLVSYFLGRVKSLARYLRRRERRRRREPKYARIGAATEGVLKNKNSRMTPKRKGNPFLTNLGVDPIFRGEPGEPVRVNYTILVVFLIVPVAYTSYLSFHDPEIRWFNMQASQDDRTADIVEQIGSSEVIGNSMDAINEDVTEEERACGLIAAATEEIFKVTLTLLHAVTGPLLASLNELRDTARIMLGQIRFGVLFAPIDLNLPIVDRSEFWIVFVLPLTAVVVGLTTIVADILGRINVCRSATSKNIVRFILETSKGAILGLGLASFQLDLVIYAVFSALNGLDVPLFNIQITLGTMLHHSILCSILCIVAGVSMYIYELVL